MEMILGFFRDIGSYIALIRVADVLDIAIIAFLLYKLLSLFKSTQAERIFFGVLFFLLVTWLASYLELHAVSYILTHVVEWGILALIILFQPEIRQLLEKLGAKNIRYLRFLKPEKERTDLEKCIDQTVFACSEMSRSKTGVLIVFEREILLDDMVRSGTELDAAVSSELLKNIFFCKLY